MTRHSLFFSGGDIEIGKLAKMNGYRVGHLTFPMYTQTPRTFTKLARQRFTWAGGTFRHAIVNIFAPSAGGSRVVCPHGVETKELGNY